MEKTMNCEICTMHETLLKHYGDEDFRFYKLYNLLVRPQYNHLFLKKFTDDDNLLLLDFYIKIGDSYKIVERCRIILEQMTNYKYIEEQLELLYNLCDMYNNYTRLMSFVDCCMRNKNDSTEDIILAITKFKDYIIKTGVIKNE